MLFDSVLCYLISLCGIRYCVFQTNSYSALVRTRTGTGTRMSFEIEELRAEPNAYKVADELINFC